MFYSSELLTKKLLVIFYSNHPFVSSYIYIILGRTLVLSDAFIIQKTDIVFWATNTNIDL